MAPVNTVHRIDWDRQLRKLKIILSLYHKENMTAPPVCCWIDTCQYDTSAVWDLGTNRDYLIRRDVCVSCFTKFQDHMLL